MKTIVITSYKGGVGKTLISFNLAGYLHSKGFKVLVIDLDGQMNMTRNMLPPDKKMKLSSLHTGSYADIYRYEPGDDRVHPNKVIFKNPLENYEGFDIIPSNTDLKTEETYYQIKHPASVNVSLAKWIKTYRKMLEKMYDFIIVDSSPNLSVGTMTALTAADEIYLITDSSPNSLNGISDLYSKWDSECENLNMDNKIRLSFANNMDIRQGISVGVLDALKVVHSDYCENFIKSSSKIKESEITGPVCFYKTAEFTKNPGVISMVNTFDEICEKRGFLVE